MAPTKKTVAVLGYMPQLGAAGEEEYTKVAETVVALGIDFLITLGEQAAVIGVEGFDKRRIFSCLSADQLQTVLLSLTGPDTMVLFKFPYKYRLSKDPEYRAFMDRVLQ